MNRGKVSEFFERNDMTIRGCRERKGKSYKPPQRHEDNRCIKNPQVMNTPHSEWFAPAQGSKGMTDAMDVRYGVGALVDGVPDIPAEMLREVEEGLAFSQKFQVSDCCGSEGAVLRQPQAERQGERQGRQGERSGGRDTERRKDLKLVLGEELEWSDCGYWRFGLACVDAAERAYGAWWCSTP